MMTRVEVSLWYHVQHFLLMSHKEATRLAILISRSSHSSNQKREPPWRQTLPRFTLISAPLEETFTGTFSFHNEAAHDTTFTLSQLMLQDF